MLNKKLKTFFGTKQVKPLSSMKFHTELNEYVEKLKTSYSSATIIFCNIGMFIYFFVCVQLLLCKNCIKKKLLKKLIWD